MATDTDSYAFSFQTKRQRGDDCGYYLFMKRLLLLSVIFNLISLYSYSQIGYQVSLLNNATGEPRANERISVTVKITDSKGNIVCDETKNETSNDFGVISMSVGDNKTFTNANWSNLPFFIEAIVDGRMIGKSQLLSVPVAEYAKMTGVLTKELLCSKEWKHSSEGGTSSVYHFLPDNTYTYTSHNGVFGSSTKKGTYEISGHTVSVVYDKEFGAILQYNSSSHCLIEGDGPLYR